MREDQIKYLSCPKCSSHLKLISIENQTENRIERGLISCSKCAERYDILNFIPRFVKSANYASNFGLEWNRHAKTQYDSYSGIPESETRFFKETKWPREMRGQIILEVGSGSGRFTEQAASTDAMVVSMDYSSAVEANYQSNGHKDNVLIVQGDIFNMPFKKNYFDKVFCFGVLQHTPYPKRAFFELPKYLKKEGLLAVDVYKKTWDVFLGSKYYIRPITKRIPPDKLYKIVVSYVNFMWPLASIIRKIPKIGPIINWIIGIADYSRMGLKGQILKEWSYLDTFDMWSPKYDYPQTLDTVKEWFREANLKDVEVHYGYNGIEGRGRR